MKPELTQDDIRAKGGFATITGDFKGSCSGNLRIDVINRTPGVAPKGPLTVADQASDKTFSLVIPTGVFVAISALCDADSDGFIKGGTDDLASNGVEVGEVTEDAGGFTIVLEAAGEGDGGPGGPPPDGGAPGKGGKGGPPGKGGKGGPPPGEQGEGAPPPGGPPPGEGPPPSE
jgi:hypothetical protein